VTRIIATHTKEEDNSMSMFKPGDMVVVTKSWKSQAEPDIELVKDAHHLVEATMGTTIQLAGYPKHMWFNEERFALIELSLRADLGEVTVDRVDEMIKERAGQWGDAETTHARIGDVWSGILGIDVSARQVALCMAGLKLVRAEINPGNEDSYVDGHAYLKFAEDFAQ